LAVNIRDFREFLLPPFTIQAQWTQIGGDIDGVIAKEQLIAANQETLIPVSCTERSRWRYAHSRRFSDAQTMMSAKARYTKMESVHKSLAFNNSFVFLTQKTKWASSSS